MRGQGRAYLPTIKAKGAAKETARESLVYWLDYSVRGVRHRESSGTTSKRDALAKLRERIGKRSDGTLTGRPEKITLADLKAALEQRYTIKGRSSWDRAAQAFVHLEAFFGEATRVIAITAERVAEYQEQRLAARAARNDHPHQQTHHD